MHTHTGHSLLLFIFQSPPAYTHTIHCTPAFELTTHTHTHTPGSKGTQGDVQGLQAVASSITTKPTSPFHHRPYIHHSFSLSLPHLPPLSLSPSVISSTSLFYAFARGFPPLTFKPTSAFEHFALYPSSPCLSPSAFPLDRLHLPKISFRVSVCFASLSSPFIFLFNLLLVFHC